MEQMLISRKQAAQMLGCSTMTVIRMEQKGLLKAVKLTGSPQARSYYSRDRIERIVASLLDNEQGAS